MMLGHIHRAYGLRRLPTRGSKKRTARGRLSFVAAPARRGDRAEGTRVRFDVKFHRADGPYRWANARLVRYADDFVIPAKYVGTRISAFVADTLEAWMGLMLNRQKTRVVKLSEPKASVDFPAYTFRFDRDLDRRRRLGERGGHARESRTVKCKGERDSETPYVRFDEGGGGPHAPSPTLRTSVARVAL